MTTVAKQFEGGFEQNVFDIVTGSAVASVFLPSGTVGMIRFKASPQNSGNFQIGNAHIRPFWLAPGDDTGWCDLDRFEQLWYEAPSGSMDLLAYWLQR